MQPVSPRVVELLNDALTFELTVTNTYFLHARMLDNWGLSRLGKVFYDLSIDEMKDADALINRILLFDGHPNVQRLNNIQVGETPEEMLRLALESERAAVAQFNAAAQECHDLGDHGTRRRLRGDGARRGAARRLVREPDRRDRAGRRRSSTSPSRSTPAPARAEAGRGSRWMRSPVPQHRSTAADTSVVRQLHRARVRRAQRRPGRRDLDGRPAPAPAARHRARRRPLQRGRDPGQHGCERVAR